MPGYHLRYITRPRRGKISRVARDSELETFLYSIQVEEITKIL